MKTPCFDRLEHDSRQRETALLSWRLIPDLGFMHGANRPEESLCPERLDDSRTAAHPVRCIAAFVENLHRMALGLQRATPAAPGRPA